MLQHVDISELPGTIQELIEVVGLSATEAIVRERGGIRLCVPKNVKTDHWLVPLIGLEALHKLVAVYQGEEIDIARCESAIRAAREQEIANSTESVAALARRHGYTERGIRKLRRRIKATFDDRQEELF